MNTRVLALACLCIGAAHTYASAPVSDETAENATVDYSVIVNGLPWAFDQLPQEKNDREDSKLISSRYHFVSKEPLGKTTGGNTSIKVELSVTDYGTPELAEENFLLIREAADPDMGLSYAWDYLLRQERAIYHLHTGCIVSEANFDIMLSNLTAAVSREGEGEPQVLRCRCGGGCQ